MGRLIRLQFYGRLRDAAGGADREADIPDGVATTNDLIEWIAASDPALGAALRPTSIKAAAGDQIIARDADIGQAGEISFLPPFSGG